LIIHFKTGCWETNTQSKGTQGDGCRKNPIEAVKKKIKGVEQKMYDRKTRDT